MASRAGKRLLTRQDWIDAALHALATGDVHAIAVDRLAKTLGATRGSFYWHFADRDALVTAALEHWERESTTALIPALDAIAQPVERLRVLFREVYEQPADAVEIALASAGDQPLVEPVFARVTKARLDVVRRIFLDLGLQDADADDRAWLVYALYIGHHQLARAAGIKALQPAQLDRLVELLTSPGARSAPPAAEPDAAAPGEGST
ncbi:MAG TPA: TetR/AcrR family transcriptional regulator [Solirubrobacteraceae bacterium]|jgi:AcrR family transcriptional regulator|nr:TetR/AcrR family transcriptional regulator [Solirubrobacteraceae bacterium]